MVARTGCPCSPNTSQNTTGNWSGSYSKPKVFARLTKASFASPLAAMPERSPLTSAANTETPARERPSASTCSVTVLPVPVAPATRPCRLAKASARNSGFEPLPTKMALSRSGFIAAPFLILFDTNIPERHASSADLSLPLRLGSDHLIATLADGGRRPMT